MDYNFNTSVQYLKGVGPQLGLKLAQWHINTLEDLIQFLPRSYQNWKKVSVLSQCKAGDYVLLPATLYNKRNYRRGPQRIFELLLEDSQKQKFIARFFRQPYFGYFDRFRCPQFLYVLGKVHLSSRGQLEFNHPELKLEQDLEDFNDQLVPIYTETKGLSSRKIHKLIEQSFHCIENQSLWVEKEYIPTWILEKYQLTSLKKALQLLHFPRLELEELFLSRRTEAHRRLIFEDFFMMEMTIRHKKYLHSQEKSKAYPIPSEMSEELKKSLPFVLTSSQLQAIKEISTDLSQSLPMNRLLQGDVGSGKTIVLFFAALQVIKSGGQVALMVPTEILAEQHFNSALKILSHLNINIRCLTSKTKAEERRDLLKALVENKCGLVIGTHSLIQEEVEFSQLGLVIIDEQHRFGVQQRFKLQAKGLSPHRLLVTATPIPRTLAMTALGDLEVSLIREKPPGRASIQNRMMVESQRELLMEFLLKKIQQGRQVYFVYPLVEESEKIDLKSAMDSFNLLKQKYPQVRWGILHGKLKPSEKENTMKQFREGIIQVLVSTTVIEVGVDVPNAVLMVIEHSERFGLSQLHQLRGRVGRGSQQSFCIFALGDGASLEAKKRIELMCETEDGFKIAEADLEWRGAGEFLGVKQSGASGFRWADLVKDEEILIQAREAVRELFKRDPELSKSEHQNLKRLWEKRLLGHTS